MSYEIEGQGKKTKAHYSHLKIWADPPTYLENYFREDKEDIVEIEQDSIEDSVHDQDKIRYYPYRGTEYEDSEKRQSSSKKRWKKLAKLAERGKPTDKVVLMVDKAVQTEYVSWMSSPIREHMIDWFDTDNIVEEELNEPHTHDSREEESFDLTRFEKSLGFPISSYILCSREEDQSSDSDGIRDNTIDNLVKELCGIQRPQEDSKGISGFFDDLEVPESIVETKQVELRNSPPRTRSKGGVEEVPNVQNRILEYEQRSKSRNRYCKKL